jgi:peptidoglycan/LPS O-acetylase OafA/YrhL
VVYVLLVLWGLNQPAPLARLAPWLRRAGLFLGDISYSLYLIHFPVLAVAGASWVAVYGGKPTSLLVPVLASLLPIPLAYVMWRLVEKPSQALGRAVGRPLPTLPRPAAVASSAG